MSKHRRPQPRGLRRSGLVLGLTAAVVVAGGGSAAAYFSESGSGRGSGTIGTMAGVTFTTTGTVSGQLYPTATVNLALTVTKLAAQAFTIQTMAQGSGGITVSGVSGLPASCPASSITVTPKSGIGQVVPAGSGTVNFAIASAVSMISTAPSTCQGATFTIPITLTGVLS